MKNYDYCTGVGISGKTYRISSTRWTSPSFCEIVKKFKTANSKIELEKLMKNTRFLNTEKISKYLEDGYLKHISYGILVLTDKGKWFYNKNKKRLIHDLL